MDFGRPENIDDVDFTLPPDHVTTKKLLASLKPGKEEIKLFVGCAKWGREDWVGKIYPEGTQSKDFLSHYVRHFNSIELNAMFYRLQPRNVIEKWAALAPTEFRFCPKYSNYISHMHQLKNADKDTKVFMDRVHAFGAKLGSCFLQLSEKFATNRAEVVQEYVLKLPDRFETCVEVRHPSWYLDDPAVDKTYEIFQDKGIGTVITDTAGRRDCLHMKLTTPTAFIRFVGNGLHPTDYLRVDEWVNRISAWINSGLREIYFFVHMHDELYSPELSKYAIEQFNTKCGTNLNVPQILGVERKKSRKSAG
jgi:uncharacterized protein YecE (DUF72 family)